jgi:hypothetical protein
MFISIPKAGLPAPVAEPRKRWPRWMRWLRWFRTEDVTPAGRLWLISDSSGVVGECRVLDAPCRAFKRGDALVLADGATVTIDRWHGFNGDYTYRLLNEDGSVYDWLSQDVLVQVAASVAA